MLQLLKYGNTNCFYIKGKYENLLIDTDWAGTLSAFYKKIKELNIKKIDYILITHYHPDHMGIVQDIIENMNTKLLVIDVQKDYIHYSDFIFKKEGNYYFKSINTDPVIISCRQSRKFLNDLGISGEIIYTPGHSDDSISIILDDGIAIVGDLNDYELANFYINEKINNSWKKILSHNIYKIYFGHYEKNINNKFNRKDVSKNG